MAVVITITSKHNGKPLQYSCLENARDRGAWWAAVHGVAQNRTRLKQLSMHACIGEGNGNPLQYSCLENPRDRESWWAAVYGVAQSRTRLSNLAAAAAAVGFPGGASGKEPTVNAEDIGMRVQSLG